MVYKFLVSLVVTTLYCQVEKVFLVFRRKLKVDENRFFFEEGNHSMSFPTLGEARVDFSQ